MRVEKTATAHALPQMIGVTVFGSLMMIAVAFLLKFEPPVVYFFIGIPCLLILLFWVNGIKEILNGGKWMMSIEHGRFAINTPSEVNFDLSLEEIAYLGFSKSSNSQSQRSSTYRIITKQGDEIILPRNPPWSNSKIKKALVEQGVEYRRL